MIRRMTFSLMSSETVQRLSPSIQLFFCRYLRPLVVCFCTFFLSLLSVFSIQSWRFYRVQYLHHLRLAVCVGPSPFSSARSLSMQQYISLLQRHDDDDEDDDEDDDDDGKQRQQHSIFSSSSSLFFALAVNLDLGWINRRRRRQRKRGFQVAKTKESVHRTKLLNCRVLLDFLCHPTTKQSFIDGYWMLTLERNG